MLHCGKDSRTIHTPLEFSIVRGSFTQIGYKSLEGQVDQKSMVFLFLVKDHYFSNPRHPNARNLDPKNIPSKHRSPQEVYNGIYWDVLGKDLFHQEFQGDYSAWMVGLTYRILKESPQLWAIEFIKAITHVHGLAKRSSKVKHALSQASCRCEDGDDEDEDVM